MRKRRKKTDNNDHMRKKKSPVLSYVTISKGILVGICAGLVVTAYRYLLNVISGFTFPLYDKMSRNPFTILAVFLGLAVLGYITGLIIKKEPMICGSGIPQVNGFLIGKMKFEWVRVLILKFVGGIIALGAGLSLGREGPSVQLGAVSGLGAANVAGGNHSKQKILLTYGAAAGLSAAFNAPFAGVSFVIEELHKSISKYVVIGAALSAFAADIIAKLVFGMDPIFTVKMRYQLPLNQYFYLVILGAVLGVMGFLFNKALLQGVNNYGRLIKKLPVEFKPIIPFLFAGVIGFWFPILLGGGNVLIEKLFESEFAISLLIAMLAVKFAFTVISYASSAPGGIFFPILSIGAVIGCILANVFYNYFDLQGQFIPTFIILAMAGYFTAVVKSPITGMILLTEMSGGFGSFLMFLTVCLTAYIVSDLLKSEPVYEMLLKNMLKNDKNIETSTQHSVIHITVKVGTYFVSSMYGNIMQPDYLEIAAIERYGENIKITDNLRIAVGDVITVKVKSDKIEEAIEYFDRPKRR